jgi:hypothetical protein
MRRVRKREFKKRCAYSNILLLGAVYSVLIPYLLSIRSVGEKSKKEKEI